MPSTINPDAAGYRPAIVGSLRRRTTTEKAGEENNASAGVKLPGLN